jgi:hypothetical protein
VIVFTGSEGLRFERLSVARHACLPVLSSCHRVWLKAYTENREASPPQCSARNVGSPCRNTGPQFVVCGVCGVCCRIFVPSALALSRNLETPSCNLHMSQPQIIKYCAVQAKFSHFPHLRAWEECVKLVPSQFLGTFLLESECAVCGLFTLSPPLLKSAFRHCLIKTDKTPDQTAPLAAFALLRMCCSNRRGAKESGQAVCSSPHSVKDLNRKDRQKMTLTSLIMHFGSKVSRAF